MRKRAVFTILGMNRDLAMSKFDASFAYENKNLRLVTDESNSKFVMTNERGPKEIGTYDKNGIEITIKGKTIGVAVVNNYLVLFTHSPLIERNSDRIYRLSFENEKAIVKLLFVGNLGFDVEHPIETIPFYENEKIQKVYWTDGINQPRMINIVDDTTTYNDDSFNFAQKIGGREEIYVNRLNSSNGLFAAGTIQYCFTYYKNYGQETNIVRISPINYISHSNRGSINENIGCAFKINVDKLDTNFDGIRIYSIQRTTIDTKPIVKRLIDYPMTTTGIIDIIDTGTIGEDITDSDLFYVGCKDVRVQTIAQKDNTLFLGNIKEKHAVIGDLLKNKLKSTAFTTKEFVNKKLLSLPFFSGYYPYRSQLNSNARDIKYFKYGETYRFGVQLQDRFGNWSDVIRITDSNDKDFVQSLRPRNSIEDTLVTYPNLWKDVTVEIMGPSMTFAEFVAELDVRRLVNLDGESLLDDYVAIRPVVVYPDQLNRTIVAQGILCPTIYNLNDRVNNNVAGQISWFARPIGKLQRTIPGNYYLEKSTTDYENLEYRHMCPIPPTNEYFKDESASSQNKIGYASRAELVCNFDGRFQTSYTLGTIYKTADYSVWANLYPQKDLNADYIGETNRAEQLSSLFFVDQSILSFHSPEIEFDTRSQVLSYDDISMRIVGIVPLTSTSENVHIDFATVDSDDELFKSSFVFNNRTLNSKKSKWQMSEFSGIKGDFSYIDDEGAGEFPIKSWYGNMRIYPWHTKTLTYKDTKEVDDELTIYDSSRAEGYAKPVSDTTIKTKCYDRLQYSFINLYCLDNGLDIDIIKPNIYLTENTGLIRLNEDEDFVDNPLGSFNFDMSIDKTVIGKTSKYSDTGNTTHRDYVLGFVPSGVCTNYDSDMNFQGNKMLSFPNIHATEGVEMKYKTTSCAILQLKSIESGILRKTSILPFISDGQQDMNKWIEEVHYFGRNDNVYWRGTAPTSFSMNACGITSHFIWDKNCKFNGISQTDISSKFSSKTTKSIIDNELGFYYIAELYRKNVVNRFGGDSDEAVAANIWLPCGDAISLRDSSGNLKNNVSIVWSEGDTYFQRYDNLHTYPYTFDDVNQIVDIVSFMCETRINIDGRYDTNRGKTNNEAMSPINFNKLNDIYTQKDNYFQYRSVDSRRIVIEDWPDIVSWSKTKIPGDINDAWTNITLASTLSLDGVKGEVRALRTHANSLFAFQDTAISKILYNENFAVTADNGVPLTIANSGKVTGKIYLSNTIGCKNKWSMEITPSYLYFVDDISRDIYAMSGEGQVSSIGLSKGFGSWIKSNVDANNTWFPGSLKSIRSLYDKNNGEIMFVTSKEALSFSELFGGFTSFYDYYNIPYLESVLNHNVMIRNGFDDTKIYEHNKGSYNDFFGVYKPFWTEIVCHSDGTEKDSPIYDKTWTNVGFIFDSFDDGIYVSDDRFDNFEISNEYQHGITDWSSRFFPTISKQFRHWNADIPRDDNNPQDRIRSQWIKAKFKKDTDLDRELKSVIHSIDISYNE